MSGNKSYRPKWRAKFPRTKREEFLQYWGSQRKLQAADVENSRTGLKKFASCDTEALQPYPFPSMTGSITAISIDQAPTGHNPRWKKEGYFGGERDVPLAANEESWSEMRTLGTDRSMRSRSEGELVDDSPSKRHNTSISSIDSPPLLSISQVGLNGYNFGPVTPFSEKSFQYQPDQEEVFPEPSPDPNRSRLYFNNVAQFLSYDPARLDPIREGDEYLLREAVHSEQNERASDFDVLCYLCSILFFLVNIGSDVALAVKYLTTEQYVFFALTVLFVALPAIVMTIFSAGLYYQDRKIMSKKASAGNWFWRVLTHVLLLAPLTRLVETLCFALKSRQDEGWRENRKNYKCMLDEDVDLTLIRLFENFLENAPQLTLQLYIMTAFGTEDDYMLSALQYVGVFTSWTSLAWSFVSFASALRNSNPGKAKMQTSSKITMFFWRFFTVGGRVIALALFASAFGAWATLVLIGAHLLVMILWMLQQNSIYCSVETKDEEGNINVVEHPYKEYFFRAMTAFILVFTFFNIAEGRTRLRALVYYTIVFAENLTMIVAWYLTASTKTHAWYHAPAIVLVIFGFFVGIGLQVMYYKCCHPIYYSKEHEHVTIPYWVPCDELSLTGPQSVQGTREAPPRDDDDDDDAFRDETRTPIYNPSSSRASSVADRNSLSGVYRSATDDVLDLNESLGYLPNSTSRREVPRATTRVNEPPSAINGAPREQAKRDKKPQPRPRERSKERKPDEFVEKQTSANSPRTKELRVKIPEPRPRERSRERTPDKRSPSAERGKPRTGRMEEIPPARRERSPEVKLAEHAKPVPQKRAATPPRSRAPPEGDFGEISEGRGAPKSPLRAVRAPDATPPGPSPFSSPEHSTPTRSPASTLTTTRADSDENLSTSEASQDVSYKMTTV